MKVKLDENLGERGRRPFEDAGHDVATVVEQGLASAGDQHVAGVCRQEQCCLVTLDLDFSNPFLFPPDDCAGIAVLRLPRRPTPNDLTTAVRTLISGLADQAIGGKLWIVERHRIREYLPEDAQDDLSDHESNVDD